MTKRNRYDNVASNFVSPGVTDAEWRPLEPAQLPTVQQPQDSTTPAEPIAIDTQGRSFASVQGSATDRVRALRAAFGLYAAVVSIPITGAVAIAWLGIQAGRPVHYGVAWILLYGAFVVAGYIRMYSQEKKHSPEGIELDRNRRAADVAIETHTRSVEAWETVSLAEIEQRYGYFRQVTQTDHEARMKRLKKRT